VVSAVPATGAFVEWGRGKCSGTFFFKEKRWGKEEGKEGEEKRKERKKEGRERKRKEGIKEERKRKKEKEKGEGTNIFTLDFSFQELAGQCI
jgi:hypothetical protein